MAPAIVGLAILAGAVLLFALMLSRKRFAKTIGDSLGKAWSRLKKLIRRSAVTDWGDRAVRFRHETIELLGKRWLPLTLTTIVSHLALYLVLLLALRHVGVSEKEISWAHPAPRTDGTRSIPSVGAESRASKRALDHLTGGPCRRALHH